MVEQQLRMISQVVSRGRLGREAALMLIEQAIPCIMHLENRVGEKLITVLLSLGAAKFQRQRNIKRLARFASNVQHIINTRVIGTVLRPKQWKVPVNQAGDAVTKVSFSNKKTRLFIDNIICLIDYIFSAPEDAELKGIWTKMVEDYRDAMLILRKPQEYTDEDIETFQTKVDDFLPLMWRLREPAKRASLTIFTC